MAATQQKQRWTRAEARAVLDRFEASGLCLATFARHQGLSYERLRKWRSRLRPEVTELAAPRLVELVAPSPQPAAIDDAVGELVLRCPSGHSIELRDVALAAGLRLLIAALDERAPC